MPPRTRPRDQAPSLPPFPNNNPPAPQPPRTHQTPTSSQSPATLMEVLRQFFTRDQPSVSQRPFSQMGSSSSKKKFSWLKSAEPQEKCSFCNKMRHTEANCWKKKGLCTRCGHGTHQAANCPRRRSAKNQKESQNNGKGKVLAQQALITAPSKPKRSLESSDSSGTKLKSAVYKFTEPKEKCPFCKKPSHTEAECWERLGLCTRCGSDEHSFENCPRRRFDEFQKGLQSIGKRKERLWREFTS